MATKIKRPVKIISNYMELYDYVFLDSCTHNNFYDKTYWLVIDENLLVTNFKLGIICGNIILTNYISNYVRVNRFGEGDVIYMENVGTRDIFRIVIVQKYSDIKPNKKIHNSFDNNYICEEEDK